MNDAGFNTCIGPLGLPLEITLTQPWNISRTGTPQVTVAQIGISASNADGACSFDATGSLHATFDTSTDNLDINGGGSGLVVDDVDGCFGLILDGDAMEWDATWNGDRNLQEFVTASTIGPDPDVVYTFPGLELNCSDSTLTGTLSRGTIVSKVGEINGFSLNGCSGPLGISYEFTQTSAWDVSINDDTVEGVTPVSIDNITLSQSNPGGACDYDLRGSVDGIFNENNQQLSVSGGGLTASNVSGCFGLMQNGDPVTFEATYQLSNIANVTIAN